MLTDIRLPQVAESMTSARLAQWLKREGDTVRVGEPLLEVETDKTTVELEAPASGILQKIYISAGADGLEVGQLLGTIGDDPLHPTEARREEGTLVEMPDAGDAAQPDEAVPKLSRAYWKPREATIDASQPAKSQDQINTPNRTMATPLARQMATAAGLDLTAIRGSGPGGRVGKADVERMLQQHRSVPAQMTDGEATATSGSPVKRAAEERALTAMRRVTAARLLESKQTIPHFYLEIDCLVDQMLEVRRRINSQDSDVALTITDIVVRAAAIALSKVPLANATWADNAVRLYEAVDIAVAVSTPAGLITPIIRSADQKPLGAISQELKDLVGRARSAQLKPDEYTGGSFTVSNLGMFGVSSLYAIINPPQSGILGIGMIGQRPIVKDGRIEIGTLMSCTLSADHRVIDGATGAELLAEFRRIIEHPWLLIV